MKLCLNDFLFATFIALAMTVGFATLERPTFGSEDFPGKTRGWMAVGYLVPYLIIPAIQPFRQQRGRAERRKPQ